MLFKSLFLYRINLAPFVYREDYFTSYQNLATSIFSFVLSFFLSNIWTFFSWLSGKKRFYNRYELSANNSESLRVHEFLSLPILVGAVG